MFEYHTIICQLWILAVIALWISNNIDFDSAYLIDDGEYIDFLVFNYIEFDFYDDVFHQATWSDCVERNVSEIVEDDSREINKKIRSVIDELRKYEHHSTFENFLYE